MNLHFPELNRANYRFGRMRQRDPRVSGAAARRSEAALLSRALQQCSADIALQTVLRKHVDS